MNNNRTFFEQRYNVIHVHTVEPKLKVPSRIGGWLQGFINGRTGTAAVGTERPLVHSGYIRSCLAGYHAYTAEMRSNLSAAVISCCANLQELLNNYSQTLLPDTAANPLSSVETIRAKRNRSERQAVILHDVIHLQELLDQNVQCYNRHVEAAAYKVSKGLACYCKGVLFRKPVRPENLPELEIKYCDIPQDFPELLPILQSVHLILNASAKKKEAEYHE